jgi:uncharacterized protein YjbJ (UPF0337 family)
MPRNVAGLSNRRNHIMNKDQTNGRVEQVKGKVNEVVGKVTNNPTRELKGDLQQAVGKTQANYGDAKEEVKKDIKREDKHH